MSQPVPSTSDLPLLWSTPPAWADRVLRQPLALLNDHAHLEKKAAANALDLLNRWPEPVPPQPWVQTMTAVARDEIDHLGVVLRILSRRGGRLSRRHHNPYAKALRSLTRLGRGPDELVDRLMTSALIEARSCERFEVLAAQCHDAELAGLYANLCASERGHYLVFLDLASQVPGARQVNQRWDEMLDAEAAIITAQPPGPGMHSGVERS